MEESSFGFLMALFIPFHLAGGIAVGVAIAKTFENGFSLSKLAGNAFLAFWGVLFGGTPFLFGVDSGMSWLLPLQALIFLGAAAGVAWRYQWLRDIYSQPGMIVGTFGLVFLIVGTVIASSIQSIAPQTGLLFGLIFGGTGLGIAILGVWMLIRSH